MLREHAGLTRNLVVGFDRTVSDLVDRSAHPLSG
jgi:hypothetical protein